MDPSVHSGAAPVPAEISAFLLEATPPQWVEAALEDIPVLLIDHANCEKKAAATAVSLLFRYGEHAGLAHRMSRLAREELRHFEQVHKIIVERNIEYRKLSASRYAEALRAELRREEPGRLVDTLIVGALIEARSCERFARLSPRLDERLSRFYRGLLESESRHFRHYLQLAEEYAVPGEVESRARVFRALESELATRPDKVFRFHSGPPPAGNKPSTESGVPGEGFQAES